MFFVDLIDVLDGVDFGHNMKVSFLLELADLGIHLLPCFFFKLLVFLNPLGNRVAKSIVNLIVALVLELLVLLHLSLYSEVHAK